MIIDSVISGLFTMVSWVIGLLPNWDPIDLSSLAGSIAYPSDYFAGGLAATGYRPGNVFGWLGWLNHYSPISEAVTILQITLTGWAAAVVARFALWVLNLLHVTGGQ